VVAALIVVLAACVRPQGTLALPTIAQSPSAIAAHAPLTIADIAMHDGEVGMAYAPVTMTVTGGVAPYHWAVSVGALPAGLALSPDGLISGTPSVSGSSQFSVQVFDSASDTAGLPRSIGIVPRLTAALVPACATECEVELGCATVCGTFGQVRGGASPLNFKLTNGVLPSGTSLSGMSLKGIFTGLPGRLSFTVLVTDGFGVTATVTPTYILFPHLSLSGDRPCSGDYLNSCTAQLPYSGGTPGASLSVKITGYSAFCTSPPRVFCYPVPSAPPGGLKVTANGGFVTLSVSAQCGGACGNNGYYGVLHLALSDQSLCAANTYCTSGPATFDVRVDPG
jgi:hypothetical protein